MAIVQIEEVLQKRKEIENKFCKKKKKMKTIFFRAGNPPICHPRTHRVR